MDIEALEKAMEEEGVTWPDIGKKLKKSRSALYRKRKGYSEFTVMEMGIICDMIHRGPEGIFYKQKVS